MKRVIPNKWCNSTFINPFLIGKFEYNHKWYECEDEHIQTLLYFAIFGLLPRSMSKLFKIDTPTDGYDYLPWRKIYKIMYRIYQHNPDGIEHTNEFSIAMDELYQYFLSQENITPGAFPVDKNNQYSQSNLIIKTFIYRKYPNIYKELKKKYPDIKIFF